MRLDDGASTLAAYLALDHADSLVVLHRGRCVLEWYREGLTKDTVHINFSVTKSVTGLLAGVLAGAGALDLDAMVPVYVPEARNSGFAQATVRHLLDMVTNLAFSENHTDTGDAMRRYRRAMGWQPGSERDDLHTFLCTLDSAGPHGTRYRYLSPSIDMLGWVCERAGALPFAELLSQNVWSPMGAENDASVTIDRLGHARSGGGLSSSARDLARIGQLLVDRGGAVVPEWYVDDLFTGGDPALWAAGDDTDLFPPGSAYRGCWYRPHASRDVLLAIGVYGQSIFVDRRRKVVVARQSHWPKADDIVAVHRSVRAAETIALAVAL